jgi:uncharacterized protein YozE (UPF0346 family)
MNVSCYKSLPFITFHDVGYLSLSERHLKKVPTNCNLTGPKSKQSSSSFHPGLFDDVSVPTELKHYTVMSLVYFQSVHFTFSFTKYNLDKVLIHYLPH